MTNNPLICEGRSEYFLIEEWQTFGFTPLTDWVCVFTVGT